ncbi:MAG: UDP-glucose 4-epimerase [Actinobacteria bacterium 13_1_20CM_3_68_9]|nr:MAG: UDP-glucose 4-epimerase [Actinobacteria bacterium 13_1_20CM_3_68_9]
MEALVTGGAGFIGSHLVDALVDRGDHVVVVDDLSTGRRENLDDALTKDAELLETDITDAAAVADVFQTRRPEVVLHLAAQIDVRRSVSDPVFDLGVNVGGTLNLLEAARQTGTRRFVLASTGGAIYGEGSGRQLPLDEQAECRPDAHYGQSKYAAEGYVSLYGRLYGLSTLSLRLGNVYGSRQDPLGEAGVVAIFCGALLGGGTPRVFGDGRQTRDYVYVGDIVEAYLAAAGSEVRGTYNVGTGVETSVLELGRLLASACEREFEPEMAPARPGEVQRIAIDSARAASDLGWRSRTALEEGLRATAASYG